MPSPGKSIVRDFLLMIELKSKAKNLAGLLCGFKDSSLA